jgi:uncharacterized protein (AIM24 family)
MFGVIMNYLKSFAALFLFFLPISVFAQVDTPTLVEPLNKAIGQSFMPVFSWEHQNTNASFTLQVSDKDDFSDLIFDVEIVAQQYYAIQTALDRSARYFYRVKAETDEGMSDWSQTNTFYTFNTVGTYSQISSTENVATLGLSHDTDGNIYMTGSFKSTADFGDDISLTSNGSTDIFVVKYNSSGEIIWAVNFGGTGDDEGQDIFVDDDGYIYVTGSFNAQVSFGDIDLSSNGFNDMFLTKLDQEGNAEWAVKAGGSFLDKGNSLSVDNDGNIYVTGDFSFSATFETINIVSNGSNDAFLAKYDNSGEILWAIGFGGSRGDYGYGLALNSNGYPVVVGVFAEEIEFTDDISITSVYNDEDYMYSNDVYLAQFDQSGDCQWAVSAGGPYFDFGLDISIDSNDDIYFTGSFDDQAYFGDIELISNGWRDVFLAKYDNDGEPIFAINSGGEDDDAGYGVCVSDDYVYLTGDFLETADFGDYSLTSMGNTDAFFAKYDKSNGDCIAAFSGGGSGDDNGWCLTCDNSGLVFASGVFEENAVFDEFNLVSSARKDVFLISPFAEPQYQTIFLDLGWNLISSYMIPHDKKIAKIFKRNIDDILIVKNSNGDLFFPALNINTITNWNIDEAYQVYAMNRFYLIVDGTQALPSDITINLDQGWNFLPFIPDGEMDIETVLADITDNMLIIKNIYGNLYFPDLNINNIGNMKPGLGYKIYMLEADQLVYPNE